MATIEGQVVLITGCSSGFGYLTSVTLARLGAAVVATMRDPGGRNAEPAVELGRVAEQEGLRLVVDDLDVTDDGSVARAVEGALARHGQIDVLVNNAGYGLIGPVEAVTVEELRALYEVNVFGPLRTSRAVLPSMRARRSGLLLHVSSTAGRQAFPSNGVYASSKWALEALGQTLRYELAPFGIDSVLVEPGGFGTRFSPSIRVPADLSRRAPYAAMTEPFMDPVHRLERFGRKVGDPQLVADAIVSLVEMPRGQRPARTFVGDVLPGLHEHNQTFAELQERFLRALQLEEALGNGP
ncbi:MAG: SDR family oxidoreductase [Chloroflexi bacterium]|nr:SDR family oxidoreductase [Chloroflexota bacterium]